MGQVVDNPKFLVAAYLCWCLHRSKSTIIPLLRWEVHPKQVEFKEEIGRGAFAKVLKGILRESPEIEVFYESRTQTVDFKEGRPVAVKLLEGQWFLFLRPFRLMCQL